MKLVLKDSANGAPEPGKDMLVVVACESAATAPRACALLKRVGREAGLSGRLIYSWWTFTALGSAPLRQLAAEDAADADMLLITANEGPGLPEAVKSWIHQWATGGGTPSCSRVLVAWLEPDQTNQGGARAVYSELKHLAELGWLDFIANGGEVRLNLPGLTATVRHLSVRNGGAPEMPDGWPGRHAEQTQRNEAQPRSQ